MAFRARVARLNEKGPALILLHGFPETSMMWEPLLTSAANAGFRVVAFDQRGYSPLARPTGTEAYRVAELTEDLLAVADAVGFDRFDLVEINAGPVAGIFEHGKRLTAAKQHDFGAFELIPGEARIGLAAGKEEPVHLVDLGEMDRARCLALG